jgi:hypothetical protein
MRYQGEEVVQAEARDAVAVLEALHLVGFAGVGAA